MGFCVCDAWGRGAGGDHCFFCVVSGFSSRSCFAYPRQDLFVKNRKYMGGRSRHSEVGEGVEEGILQKGWKAFSCATNVEGRGSIVCLISRCVRFCIVGCRFLGIGGNSCVRAVGFVGCVGAPHLRYNRCEHTDGVTERLIGVVLDAFRYHHDCRQHLDWPARSASRTQNLQSSAAVRYGHSSGGLDCSETTMAIRLCTILNTMRTWTMW